MKYEDNSRSIRADVSMAVAVWKKLLRTKVLVQLQFIFVINEIELEQIKEFKTIDQTFEEKSYWQGMAWGPTNQSKKKSSEHVLLIV